MKKNLFTILMVACVFFAASCSKDEVEEPTLTLSETGIIDFPKAASEKSVTVTTNQTEWTAMANVDWIEIVESGNTLTIKAVENTTTVSRKAKIKVIAGGIGRGLEVTQAATDVTIATIPDKLEIDQWGGTYQFDVNANTKNWTVTSDADWVKVTPRQFKNEVMVEVAENTLREARVAKLTLAGDGNKGPKEFTIIQNGIMYYIMPYLEMGASLTKLKAFETARKSEMLSDVYSVLGGPYTFNTKSSVFPSIEYTFVSERMRGATIKTALKKEELGGVELNKFFTDNKFKLVSEKAALKVYEQESEKVIITATVAISDNGAIAFTSTPKQPQDYPTYDAMPYGFIDFTASKGTVQEWEGKNGGKYNLQISDPAQGLLAFTAPEPWIMRCYMFETRPVLVQTMNFLPEINRIYFEYEGSYIVTKEFKALMEKEGFVYVGQSQGGLSLYDSKTKNLRMGIKVARYSNVNDTKPTIEMRFSLIPTSGGSSSLKDDARIDKTPKKLQAKVILF